MNQQVINNPRHGAVPPGSANGNLNNPLVFGMNSGMGAPVFYGGQQFLNQGAMASPAAPPVTLMPQLTMINHPAFMNSPSMMGLNLSGNDIPSIDNRGMQIQQSMMAGQILNPVNPNSNICNNFAIPVGMTLNNNPAHKFNAPLEIAPQNTILNMENIPKTLNMPGMANKLPVNFSTSLNTAKHVQSVADTASIAATTMVGSDCELNLSDTCSDIGQSAKRSVAELTIEDKLKQNRDRNREHARSTRLRKKAYVNSLKEQVEKLHEDRAEDEKSRRVSIQQLADVQNVRRAVIRSFLQFHSNFEIDPRKWNTILEDDFCLKQPVTPYRFFRSTEIDCEHRMSRGVDATIADAASMAVLIDAMGSRNSRWMHLKREDFLVRQELKHGGQMSSSTIRRYKQLQLSSCTYGSNNEGEAMQQASRKNQKSYTPVISGAIGVKKEEVELASYNPDKQNSTCKTTANCKVQSNEYHDYNAPSLPDPMLDSGENASCDSQGGTVNNISTDSSSTDEDRVVGSSSKSINSSAMTQLQEKQAIHRVSGVKSAGILIMQPNTKKARHRLNTAPAIPLPPFSGIGKRPKAVQSSQPSPVSDSASIAHTPTRQAFNPVKDNIKPINSGSSTSSLSNTISEPDLCNQLPRIQAYYHVNEDDLLIANDIIMCPFVLRSKNAVVCGATGECTMPGMLRGQFSHRNKLIHLEMIYDAMGFMQQLGRASGSEDIAQIIPNMLEMALSPNIKEARVITMAKSPFLIVSVNDIWTRMTKYTQLEVEGKSLSILNGKKTDMQAGIRQGKPIHDFSEVANGICASSVNVHYDKYGRGFVDHVCSYPLTTVEDEVTHLLHVHQELPAIPSDLEF